MDKENRGSNYQRNNACGKKNSNKSKGIRVTEMTKRIVVTEDKSRVIQEKQREFWDDENDDTQLLECMLGKLWDSVPREAQILPNSQSDENSDSDRTESGLDQGDDDDDDDDDEKENAGQSQTSELSYLSTYISQEESSFRQVEDPKMLWEVNFDFIQAIIWLKSSVTRLQRIPADQFRDAFKNQWRLSRKIMSNQRAKCEAKAAKTVAANASPTFRKPLNPVNEELSLPSQENAKNIDTKLCERVELLKQRLRTRFDSVPENLGVDLILETDESELRSISSTNSQGYFPGIKGSETMEHRLNFDSGFHSGKAESMDSVNTCNAAEMIESRSATEMETSIRNSVAVEGPKKTNSVQLPSKNPSKVAVAQTGKTISNKRRHEGISLANLKRKSSKWSKSSISSAMLKCVLRGLECNQLLFRSVKAILNVLKIEESASSSTEWHGSVHKEAIKAVVSVVDQLDKEEGPDLCRKKVVDTIEEVFKKMLRSNELDKETTWEHHRLMILELCNVSSVCTSVVDYLIEELENLIPTATQSGEHNSRGSANLLQKFFIIFHSLKIVLKKYRALVPRSVNADTEEPSEKIVEVTELWRRDSKMTPRVSDVFVAGLTKPKNREDREKIWIKVLEELVVASTRYWPLVKVLAWECLSILKSLDG